MKYIAINTSPETAIIVPAKQDNLTWLADIFPARLIDGVWHETRKQINVTLTGEVERGKKVIVSDELKISDAAKDQYCRWWRDTVKENNDLKAEIYKLKGKEEKNV